MLTHVIVTGPPEALRTWYTQSPTIKCPAGRMANQKDSSVDGAKRPHRGVNEEVLTPPPSVAGWMQELHGDVILTTSSSQRTQSVWHEILFIICFLCYAEEFLSCFQSFSYSFISLHINILCCCIFDI